MWAGRWDDSWWRKKKKKILMLFSVFALDMELSNLWYLVEYLTMWTFTEIKTMWPKKKLNSLFVEAACICFLLQCWIITPAREHI